jgi:hypothetical protein
MDESMLEDLKAAIATLSGAANVQGKGGEAFVIASVAPAFRAAGDKGAMHLEQVAADQRLVGDTRLNAKGLRLIWATEAFVVLGDIITAEEAWDYSAQISSVKDVALFRANVRLGVEALDKAQGTLDVIKADRAVKAEANKAQPERLEKRLKAEWELASQYGMSEDDFIQMVKSVLEGSLVTV